MNRGTSGELQTAEPRPVDTGDSEPEALGADTGRRARPATAATAHGFIVDQDGFRGSLSELATALRRGRIEPGALDLQTLVDGFLAYFERHAERDLDVASEALPAVAQVVELKLRLLLPRPPRTAQALDEDLQDEVTAAVESLARLEEAIAFLRERRERRRHVFAARAPRIDFPRRVAPTRVALAQLAALAARFRENAYFELVRDRLSVPEAMRRLLERLGRLRRADFESLAAPSDWAARTVYFVGLLELVRERRVRAAQSAAFGAIVVEHLDDGEPFENGEPLDGGARVEGTSQQDPNA